MEGSLVSKTDLQALAGPSVTRLVPDPLAVVSLNNQLYVSPKSHMKIGQN